MINQFIAFCKAMTTVLRGQKPRSLKSLEQIFLNDKYPRYTWSRGTDGFIFSVTNSNLTHRIILSPGSKTLSMLGICPDPGTSVEKEVIRIDVAKSGSTLTLAEPERPEMFASGGYGVNQAHLADMFLSFFKHNAHLIRIIGYDTLRGITDFRDRFTHGAQGG